MDVAMTNAAKIEVPVAAAPLGIVKRTPQTAKLRLLMVMFGLSLRDVCDGSGRAISRSQLHRILHGQRPTPTERRAIALGVVECLKVRCDSAFLFGD